AARRLDLTTRAQDDNRWARELSGNQLVKRRDFTTLNGAEVVVWGFGSIGQHLAPMLSALGARVTGVARQAGTRAGYPVITPDDLPAHLPSTDVLVSILPASPSTQGVINRDVFEALPTHAWVINVGRGAVVDDSDLITALEQGLIGGAALDVFREEPLPPTSPLWQAPNMIITPHTAGGRPVNSGARIEENLRRYLAGEELIGSNRPE
ncbi:MAG TPA: NAD(P)-dependent oxidoreductase, partial [Beutenbergiaceae bacterium]|nr:NAD(P)-dependent oxidoreductase [Beutenbergiaceae bacterium]